VNKEIDTPNGVLIKPGTKLRGVINHALKTGKLKFSTQHYENNQEGRNGYSSEDITGFYVPDSLLDYIKANIMNYIESVKEFGFIKAFSFCSFKLPWSGWVWVVSSVGSIGYDLIDSMIREEENPEKKELLQKNYHEYAKSFSRDEIYYYLNSHFLKLSAHIWVNRNDPTDLVYDEKYKPYNLPDGWSTEQLGQILAEWFKEITNQSIEPLFIEDAKW